MILNAFFYTFLIIGTALWALGIQVPTPDTDHIGINYLESICQKHRSSVMHYGNED